MLSTEGRSSGIFPRFLYSGTLGGIGKLVVVLLHLPAEEESHLFFGGQALVFLHLLNLGIPGLDGKVCLGFGNLFLSRVTVLSNKVAGVSGKFYILDFFLGDTGFYYFADVSKIG